VGLGDPIADCSRFVAGVLARSYNSAKGGTLGRIGVDSTLGVGLAVGFAVVGTAVGLAVGFTVGAVGCTLG
jgi:hypothetical protein